MTVDLDPHDEKSRLARRRLLRGSFSAPAVLTLYSGGALAASSSMRCATNQTNQPVPASSSNSISWIRVPVYQVTWQSGKRGNNKKTHTSLWVRGSDLRSLGPTGPGAPTFDAYLTASQWQCLVTGGPTASTPAKIQIGGAVLDIAALQIVSSDPGPTVVDRDGNSSATTGTATQSAVTVPVRIESVSGGFKVAGIDGYYEGGTAMPTSCWTSFGGRTV